MNRITLRTRNEQIQGSAGTLIARQLRHGIGAAAIGLAMAVAVLTVVQPPAARGAGSWYVSSSGSDGVGCGSSGAPCGTLQYAEGLASAGDTLYVAAGTFTGVGPNVVTVTKSLVLSGGWNPSFTTQSGVTLIDGQNARRGIQVNANAATTIISLTVANGFVNTGPITGGGGILTSSPIVLTDVTLKDNASLGGGGGMLALGNATLTRGLIQDNACTGGSCYGGGVSVGGDATVNGTTFIHNTNANRGGALDVVGSLSIANARFERNESLNFGGAVYVDSTLALTDTVFYTNTAGYQGGALMSFGPATLTRPIASDNIAENEGGAFAFGIRAPATIVDGLISNNASNIAAGGGIAGVSVGSGVAGTNPITLVNTSLLNNTAHTGGGGIVSRARLTMTGGTVSGNVALEEGGGISIGGDSGHVIQSVRILNNSAATGGGVAANNSVMTVTASAALNNNFFGANTATGTGEGADLTYYGVAAFNLTGQHNTFYAGPASTRPSITIGGVGTNDSLALTNSIFDSYTVGVAAGPQPATTTLTGVLWSGVGTPTSGTVTVSGAVTGAAEFVNTATLDLHITYGSDAFNAGGVSTVAVDIDGETRPLYGVADLGADELDLSTDLAVSKRVTPSFVKPGDTITYTLTYTNVGSKIAYSPFVTDVVPAGLTNLAVSSSGSAITATGAVTYSWQTADLAPGAGGTITITAQVGNGVGTPTTINNTAQIASWVGDPNSVNNSGSVGFQVDTPISGLAAQTNGPKPPNSAITFTATVSAGTNVTYAWAFGDGATGSGSPVTHAYSALGQYTATLTATNPLGSSVITVPVTIVDVPIVGLALNGPGTAMILQPTTYTASVTQGSNVTYAWEIDGVAAGTGSSPALTFTTLGNRTVKVTATNSQGSQTTSVTVTVTPIRLYFASMMK